MFCTEARASEDSNMVKKVTKRTTVQTRSTAKKKNRLSAAPIGSGAAVNEQDPKRRLGNFAGAGEHARQGGRSSGIVGQTKQRNRTDKKSKKSK
jgi:hypothetical protein